MSELYSIFKQSAGVSTDTRTIKPGQMYFALKGENFDGNRYARQALEAGALCAVVSEAGEDIPGIIKVNDTLEALKALAREHRDALGIPVVGLTGTNGKTTTKELIREVLSAKFEVVATEGNLNNEIGVPLSVLKFRESTQIGIIEMGASHPEDLRPLLEVAAPDFGLITNVGKAHLLGFGSFEGVKHAKGLLYDYLSSHGGRVFANTSDPVLTAMLADRGITDFEGYASADAEVIPGETCLCFNLRCRTVRTNLVGAYNAANVMAALCIGRYFGVEEDAAIRAVEAYVPSNKRSQLMKTGRNTLIVDAYNANPSSMAVALSNLELCAAPRAAVLGDMRELGEDSLAEHRGIVERLGTFEKVFLAGGEFTKAAEGRYPCFETSEALAAYLLENPLEGYTVLVKGSRGMEMEKVISSL